MLVGKSDPVDGYDSLQSSFAANSDTVRLSVLSLRTPRPLDEPAMPRTGSNRRP